MKTKRFIVFLLAVLLLFSICASSVFAETEATAAPTESSAPAEQDLLPDSELLPVSTVSTALGSDYTVDAKAAVLLELNSNTIIYSLNADEQLYPASLTKIITCMLALDYGNLDDIVTVSETALQGLHEDGSSAGLVAGEQLTLRNLLYCIMLSSANEACNVVAEYISGDVDSFVALMNKKAAAIGCHNTHFANPHGLHDESHYTTANDLCLIARKALENPTFRDISSTTTYTVPATNLCSERHLVTTNYLISKDTISDYYYPNASGIKTGFTTPAGRCLISTAKQDGAEGEIEFLSVLLGAETEVLSDGNVWYHSFSETADLFDYGFENFDYAEVITDLNPVASVSVRNAFSSNAKVVLKPSASVDALLPKDYDKAKIVTDYELDGGVDHLTAPLAAGTPVGTVRVYYDNVLIGQVSLETLTDVEKSEIASAFSATKSFFSEYWWIILLLGVVIVLLAAVLLIRSAMVNAKRREAARRRRPGGPKIVERTQK